MKPAETAIPRSDPPALPASSNSAAASLCLAILKLLSRLLDAILLGIAGILFLLGLLALADNARIYAEADSRVYQACRPAGTRSGFAALHSRNPEVLGWISIPGTKIDYPFVQGSDNREYANLSPERKFSLAGSLFLDSRNAPDCSDFNTLLYGHHMDDYKTLGIYDAYYEELKYLAGVNILECLKKTRDVQDRKMTEKFIQVCFWFLRNNFPEFPKCRYRILREKYDWIYANPALLRRYLSYRRRKAAGNRGVQ